MPRLSRTSLVALFFATVAVAKADTCITGKLRHRMHRTWVEEASAYCYNVDKTALKSNSCSERGACAAESASLRKLDRSALNSTLGSPGFNLCYAAGGRPQLLEFWADERWFELDRCTFPRDGSYVSTGLLAARLREEATAKQSSD